MCGPLALDYPINYHRNNLEVINKLNTIQLYPNVFDKLCTPTDDEAVRLLEDVIP